jgi:hypothetical protein
MNKARTVLMTALGAMTPALLVEEEAKAHTAYQAVAVEFQHGAPGTGPEPDAMKSALLALSPADKLRLGGDRIRLAKAKKKARGRGGRAGKGFRYTDKSWCDWCDIAR